MQNMFYAIAIVWFYRGGGHSHMSVDIKCLSIDPFLRRSYTQWPPSSVHTQWPLFFHLGDKFYIQWQIFARFRTHFEKFINFAAMLT